MSDAKLPIYRDVVRPEWIDYNEHMNDGFYVVAFSLAIGELQSVIGMGETYRKQTGGTLYTAELHTNYLRELKVDTPIHIISSLLYVDAKRIHLFQSMFNSDEKYLAATMEIMLLHVDQNIGRVTPMPEEILQNLEQIAADDAKLRRHPNVGRFVGQR